MKKFFALSFIIFSLVSPVLAQDNSVSFSPLDLIQKEAKSNSAGVLSSVLEKYNPEDFVSCGINGSPEVVRDKANTFRVNAGINFNTEMYYGKFIPELTNALDELSEKTRKTSGYFIELYDRPEPFGPKYYSFSNDKTERLSEILKGFRLKALRVKGITIELQNANMKTIHRIKNQIPIQYLVFESSEGNNKSVWTFSPSIINFSGSKRTIDSKLILQAEFVIPDSILPNVRNIKASLLIEGNEERRPGWLGVAVTDVTLEKADSSGLISMEGAMINSVAEGGAAEKAGLKHGDVVLSLNGERVMNGVTFANKVRTFKEGDVIAMIINRDGKSYDVKITLGARPE